MMKLLLIIALMLAACDAFAQQGASPGPLPACEGCGASEAPGRLTSAMTIAPADEPGTHLVIRGRILHPDGRRPAAGVLLYAYHTNAEGIYAKRGDERGNARRHGYLRGWLLTDADGRFTIHTIRPGPYPARGTPAHIHVTITPPGGREQWANEILFADDPLVSRAAPGEHANATIVRTERQADGSLLASVDLVLDASGRREIGDFVLSPASRAPDARSRSGTLGDGAQAGEPTHREEALP